MADAVDNNYLSIDKILLIHIIYFLTIPLGFFIRVFYSKTLSISEFGIFYAMIAFFSFLTLFTNFGFSSSLRYFIPKYLAKKNLSKIRNLFYYAYVLQLFLVFLFSIIVYFFSFYIAKYYFGDLTVIPILKLFLFYFIFSNLIVTLLDVLTSYGKTTLYQIIYFLQLLLILSLSFFYVYFDFVDVLEAFILIWGFVLFAIFFIYSIFTFKNYPYLLKKPSFSLSAFKEFFKYSNYVFFGGVALSIFHQIDLIMITYFFDFEEVAYYSNVVALINIMVGVFGVINLILLPYFSNLYAKDDFKRLRSFFNTLYRLILYLILPCVIVFAFYSKELLSFIFGSEYAGSYSILLFLSFFAIFKIFNSYHLSFVSGVGLAKKIPFFVSFLILFNVILNLIFLYLFGLIGIAISTGFAWALLFFLTYNVISKEIGFKFQYLQIFRIFLFTFILSICLYYAKNNFFIYDGLISAFIIISLFILAYFILGFVFKLYSFKELFIFIPDKLRPIVENFFNKYLSFLIK